MTKFNSDKSNHPGFALEDLGCHLGAIRKKLDVTIRKNIPVRVHPDAYINAVVGYIDHQWFLFDGRLIDEYGELISYISNAILFLAIDKSGEEFILPVTEPWSSYPESWRDSLLDIVDVARNNWVIIDKDGYHKKYIMEKSLLSEQPDWSPESFQSLLNRAFPGELYVNSIEHPIMKGIMNQNDW
jgi:hypothetical protein